MASLEGGRGCDPVDDGVYSGGEFWGSVLAFAPIMLAGVPNAVFH